MSGAGPSLPPPPSVGGNILRYCGEIWRHLRRTRVKAGNGMRLTQTEDGVILSRLASDEESTKTPFPFEISAEFDDPAAPTVCLVNIAPGTLTGQISGAGSYTGNPLFEGSGGATLASAPTYNVGVTEQTTYFYLNVTTDNEGKIKNCWIDAIVAADVATTAVDVPYVQEDFPAIGDPGNDGVYFFPIGYAEIIISGTSPNFITTVECTNTLQASAVFWTCGGAGVFGGIAPA